MTTRRVQRMDAQGFARQVGFGGYLGFFPATHKTQIKKLFWLKKTRNTHLNPPARATGRAKNPQNPTARACAIPWGAKKPTCANTPSSKGTAHGTALALGQYPCGTRAC